MTSGFAQKIEVAPGCRVACAHQHSSYWWAQPTVQSLGRRAPAAWRRPGHVLIALVCCLAALSHSASAQTSTPAVKDKSILSQVRFEQRLDTTVPLDAR